MTNKGFIINILKSFHSTTVVLKLSCDLRNHQESLFSPSFWPFFGDLILKVKAGPMHCEKPVGDADAASPGTTL